MNAIDLKQAIKPYTTGWVAINKKTNKVIAHAENFSLIAKRIQESKDILLIPASKEYVAI